MTSRHHGVVRGLTTGLIFLVELRLLGAFDIELRLPGLVR